ncbi:BTB/POZ domain-containing protein [Canna indica]|uniref:BTB/POZ domain-containing protein n=1 Tax=Canna indica TaxID=4628 RepID=A0AAQ3JNI0_9LILI|nr:BTB/POZ domain-containing protein [Canna indica]
MDVRSEETGLPPTVCVRFQEKSFNLHRVRTNMEVINQSRRFFFSLLTRPWRSCFLQLPLTSRSGYFKKALLESSDVVLPRGFPGGPETFEMVALFSYGSPLPLDPFVVSALRCAAEFLEMTEEYATRNLCETSDLYLNQVVLQSWDDTLIALQTCQTLLPMAEELLVVSRCVESLAFMSCMEILDPEQRRDHPVVTLHALAGRPWNPEAVKEMAGQDLWIKDLIALPFEFFTRIIRSLRRQGMKEKYVIPIVIFYANKWVLSKKTHKFWENTAEEDGADAPNNKVSTILQGILDLLPACCDSGIIPVTFFFALLSMSLALNLSDGIRSKLQDHVASLLHFARVEDFLLPHSNEDIACSPELRTMERIVSIHVSSKNESGYVGCTPSSSGSVADLWDKYLCQIAIDPKLGADRFTELVQTVQMADRETHDHLYKAINTFLSARPQLCNADKARLCSKISCQKLSQETCIQAVQDELMPLRLIIQALFVQQLHTQQAFRDCSESFRYIQCGDFSGSIPNSTCQLPKSQNLEESPCNPAAAGESSAVPLGSLLKKERAFPNSDHSKEVYESTRFRIQALEQELASLKHSMQSNDISKSSLKTDLKKESFRLFAVEGSRFVRRNPLGHVSGCIGSLSWASQRRYANRLLKVFRRIALLGRGKSKIKQRANGSLSCRSKPLHEMYDC